MIMRAMRCELEGRRYVGSTKHGVRQMTPDMSETGVDGDLISQHVSLQRNGDAPADAPVANHCADRGGPHRIPGAVADSADGRPPRLRAVETSAPRRTLHRIYTGFSSTVPFSGGISHSLYLSIIFETFRGRHVQSSLVSGIQSVSVHIATPSRLITPTSSSPEPHHSPHLRSGKPKHAVSYRIKSLPSMTATPSRPCRR